MPARAWLARLREDYHLRLLAIRSGSRFHVRDQSVSVVRGDKEIRIARRNTVYARDLIRDFSYYFEAVQPAREGTRWVVDYSTPALHRMKNEDISLWFPQLAEPMETTHIYIDRARLKPGDVVFDCGAYAGGATYYFSRAVGPSGRVFAFEPDPASFACLVKNTDLHALRNVTPLHRGVWSRTGRVTFQAEGNMGSAVVDASDRDSDTKTEIDVVTLSDFCSEQSIERVDFIKLDVEGSEVQILETAGSFFQTYRPSIIIEVHRVNGVRTDDSVCQILAKHGYSTEVVPQAGLELPLIFGQPRENSRRS